MKGQIANSTLRRGKELRRTSWIARGRKEIPKVNPARQAKKRKQYATLLAAYRRSATYRVVEKRAGGRCERVWEGRRCEYRGPLIHNHLHYQRLGGQELPSDVEAICPTCNGIYEGERPWRRGGRRKAS